MVGNDAADKAADFGRRGVGLLVIDARRDLAGVCSRWYPVVREGAFYSGQFRLRPSSFRPILLRPGATWTKPKIKGLSSSKARCNLGQFCEKTEKMKIKKGREKETKGRDNQYSPCFCEGVASRRPAMLHMKVC